MCHCGAVVKELLARAEKPVRLLATLFSVSLYRFFLIFFFNVWSLSFNTIFPFGLFFFILTADPAGPALGSILEKGFQKLLICILVKLTTRKKP